MSYSIRPLYFSHMYRHVPNPQEKVHAIVYDKCNFKCKFCTAHLRDKNEYKEYSEDEFIYVSSQLLLLGKSFKFTGGEPTLNKYILRDTKIVKDLGGFIYLDTNGSHPNIVQQMIDMKTIDVLSISLKGLSKVDAAKTSNCKVESLCWNNVLQTIELGCNNGITTIITYVINSLTNIYTLLDYVDIFESYNNIIFKFNNLFYQNDKESGLIRKQENEFSFLTRELLSMRPNLKNRIIVCDNEESITNFSAHIYL